MIVETWNDGGRKITVVVQLVLTFLVTIAQQKGVALLAADPR